MNKYINKQVKDLDTNKIESVINITTNSILITQTKLTKDGINCSQWFNDKQFEKKFLVL